MRELLFLGHLRRLVRSFIKETASVSLFGDDKAVEVLVSDLAFSELYGGLIVKARVRVDRDTF